MLLSTGKEALDEAPTIPKLEDPVLREPAFTHPPEGVFAELKRGIAHEGELRFRAAKTQRQKGPALSEY